VGRSAPVDGFALAYDRSGAADPVLLLHGWPGDRTDFDAVVGLLEGQAEVVVPATVLWPEHDPLFPPAWSDRLEEFFTAVTLEHLVGAGHFTPVEAPEAFATAIRRALA
jgi:pimeloyl-ACP methyl ester carboxylesterase